MASRCMGLLSTTARVVAHRWGATAATTTSAATRRSLVGCWSPAAAAVRPTQQVWTTRGFSTASKPSGRFAEAIKAVTRLEAADNSDKLALYALYKQATEGVNTTPKPGMFDIIGKAKWDAWTALGSMSPTEAEDAYIVLAETMGASIGGGDDTAAAAAAGAGYKTLNVQTRAGVTTIMLNRPEKYNAFNFDMYNEVIDALDQAAKDPECVVATLTGAGRFYSSGNDLASFSAMPPEGPAKLAEDAAVLLEAFVEAFIGFPKVLVAAVNGPAIGVAATTLALCDVVYASHTATFNTPFPQLGQSPEACSSLTFPEILGPALANDVLLCGRKLTATEARNAGLVAEVFEASEFHNNVAERVFHTAAQPTKSLQYSKALVRDEARLALLRKVNRAECDRLRERWVSDDCMKALAAFMKRKSS